LEWGFAASIALALTVATLIATHEFETIDMNDACSRCQKQAIAWNEGELNAE
jgi:hypothetical protein